MISQKYYTVKEVADMLRVDPRTIRKAIDTGKLKASMVGREYRIAEKDLEKYLSG